MNQYATFAQQKLFSQDSSDHNEFENHFHKRIKILKETILAFQSNKNYHNIAYNNLNFWKSHTTPTNKCCDIQIVPYDWGVSTLQFTKIYGSIFTVLNMANPHYPGGGYMQGCVAQEENMFRRSDCHFSIQDNHFDFDRNRYSSDISNLLSAKDGIVYIDKTPRVCIRNQENIKQSDLGYEWMQDNDIFPFIEMRAAAQDCRYSVFDEKEADRRICAQFNTLIKHNIQHVILGAFGCGAFNNPSETIAHIYKKYIDQLSSHFRVIVFSIYNAGYGPDNYTIFKKILQV